MNPSLSSSSSTAAAAALFMDGFHNHPQSSTSISNRSSFSNNSFSTSSSLMSPKDTDVSMGSDFNNHQDPMISHHHHQRIRSLSQSSNQTSSSASMLNDQFSSAALAAAAAAAHLNFIQQYQNNNVPTSPIFDHMEQFSKMSRFGCSSVSNNYNQPFNSQLSSFDSQQLSQPISSSNDWMNDLFVPTSNTFGSGNRIDHDFDEQLAEADDILINHPNLPLFDTTPKRMNNSSGFSLNNNIKNKRSNDNSTNPIPSSSYHHYESPSGSSTVSSPYSGPHTHPNSISSFSTTLSMTPPSSVKSSSIATPSNQRPNLPSTPSKSTNNTTLISSIREQSSPVTSPVGVSCSSSGRCHSNSSCPMTPYSVGGPMTPMAIGGSNSNQSKMVNSPCGPMMPQSDLPPASSSSSSSIHIKHEETPCNSPYSMEAMNNSSMVAQPSSVNSHKITDSYLNQASKLQSLLRQKTLSEPINNIIKRSPSEETINSNNNCYRTPSLMVSKRKFSSAQSDLVTNDYPFEQNNYQPPSLGQQYLNNSLDDFRLDREDLQSMFSSPPHNIQSNDFPLMNVLSNNQQHTKLPNRNGALSLTSSYLPKTSGTNIQLGLSSYLDEMAQMTARQLPPTISGHNHQHDSSSLLPKHHHNNQSAVQSSFHHQSSVSSSSYNPIQPSMKYSDRNESGSCSNRYLRQHQTHSSQSISSNYSPPFTGEDDIAFDPKNGLMKPRKKRGRPKKNSINSNSNSSSISSPPIDGSNETNLSIMSKPLPPINSLFDSTPLISSPYQSNFLNSPPPPLLKPKLSNEFPGGSYNGNNSSAVYSSDSDQYRLPAYVPSHPQATNSQSFASHHHHNSGVLSNSGIIAKRSRGRPRMNDHNRPPSKTSRTPKPSSSMSSSLASLLPALSNTGQTVMKRGRGRPKSLKTLLKEAEQAGHTIPQKVVESYLANQRQKEQRNLQKQSKNQSLSFDDHSFQPSFISQSASSYHMSGGNMPKIPGTSLLANNNQSNNNTNHQDHQSTSLHSNLRTYAGVLSDHSPHPHHQSYQSFHDSACFQDPPHMISYPSHTYRASPSSPPPQNQLPLPTPDSVIYPARFSNGRCPCISGNNEQTEIVKNPFDDLDELDNKLTKVNDHKKSHQNKYYSLYQQPTSISDVSTTVDNKQRLQQPVVAPIKISLTNNTVFKCSTSENVFEKSINPPPKHSNYQGSDQSESSDHELSNNDSSSYSASTFDDTSDDYEPLGNGYISTKKSSSNHSNQHSKHNQFLKGRLKRRKLLRKQYVLTGKPKFTELIMLETLKSSFSRSPTELRTQVTMLNQVNNNQNNNDLDNFPGDWCDYDTNDHLEQIQHNDQQQFQQKSGENAPKLPKLVIKRLNHNSGDEFKIIASKQQNEERSFLQEEKPSDPGLEPCLKKLKIRLSLNDKDSINKDENDFCQPETKIYQISTNDDNTSEISTYATKKIDVKINNYGVELHNDSLEHEPNPLKSIDDNPDHTDFFEPTELSRDFKKTNDDSIHDLFGNDLINFDSIENRNEDQRLFRTPSPPPTFDTSGNSMIFSGVNSSSLSHNDHLHRSSIHDTMIPISNFANDNKMISENEQFSAINSIMNFENEPSQEEIDELELNPLITRISMDSSFMGNNNNHDDNNDNNDNEEKVEEEQSIRQESEFSSLSEIENIIKDDNTTICEPRPEFEDLIESSSTCPLPENAKNEKPFDGISFPSQSCEDNMENIAKISQNIERPLESVVKSSVDTSVINNPSSDSVVEKFILPVSSVVSQTINQPVSAPVPTISKASPTILSVAIKSSPLPKQPNSSLTPIKHPIIAKATPANIIVQQTQPPPRNMNPSQIQNISMQPNSLVGQSQQSRQPSPPHQIPMFFPSNIRFVTPTGPSGPTLMTPPQHVRSQPTILVSNQQSFSPFHQHPFMIRHPLPAAQTMIQTRTPSGSSINLILPSNQHQGLFNPSMATNIKPILIGDGPRFIQVHPAAPRQLMNMGTFSPNPPIMMAPARQSGPQPPILQQQFFQKSELPLQQPLFSSVSQPQQVVSPIKKIILEAKQPTMVREKLVESSSKIETKQPKDILTEAMAEIRFDDIGFPDSTPINTNPSSATMFPVDNDLTPSTSPGMNESNNPVIIPTPVSQASSTTSLQPKFLNFGPVSGVTNNSNVSYPSSHHNTQLTNDDLDRLFSEDTDFIGHFDDLGFLEEISQTVENKSSTPLRDDISQEPVQPLSQFDSNSITKIIDNVLNEIIEESPLEMTKDEAISDIVEDLLKNLPSDQILEPEQEEAFSSEKTSPTNEIETNEKTTKLISLVDYDSDDSAEMIGRSSVSQDDMPKLFEKNETVKNNKTNFSRSEPESMAEKSLSQNLVPADTSNKAIESIRNVQNQKSSHLTSNEFVESKAEINESNKQEYSEKELFTSVQHPDISSSVDDDHDHNDLSPKKSISLCSICINHPRRMHYCLYDNNNDNKKISRRRSNKKNYNESDRKELTTITKKYNSSATITPTTKVSINFNTEIVLSSNLPPSSTTIIHINSSNNDGSSQSLSSPLTSEATTTATSTSSTNSNSKKMIKPGDVENTGN